jgi:hypothetical protein
MTLLATNFFFGATPGSANEICSPTDCPTFRKRPWRHRTTAVGDFAVWLLLAGLRPSGSAVATCLAGLHLSLLGDLQRVVNLDSEVSDRAFKFAVTEHS